MRSSGLVAAAICVLGVGCAARTGVGDGERPVLLDMNGEIGFSRGGRLSGSLDVAPGYWLFGFSDPGPGVTIGVTGDARNGTRTLEIAFDQYAPLGKRAVTMVATGCDDAVCTNDELRSERYMFVLDVINQYASDDADSSSSEPSE